MKPQKLVDLIGNTPLVESINLVTNKNRERYGKYRWRNVSTAVMDRHHSNHHGGGLLGYVRDIFDLPQSNWI